MRKGYEPKLPAKQLAILAVARFAEPLALTSVFPYLPEMIESFGIPKDNVARWAGLTGAVFSLSQSATAVPWGKASDTIGRKPTICLGLVSTMICFIIWGMSTSLPMAITVRAIMGGGNGNVGIIRTMVAEMVPEKELQPTAFSIMPLVWSIGSVFGPSFGGFFARPAEQYPSVFGDSWLFKTYPFLLPNLMACIFFFISVVTAVLFLKETLETKRHERDWGLILGEKLVHPFRKSRRSHHQRKSFVDDEATAPLLSHSGVSHVAKHHKVSPQPTLKEIFSRQVIICIVAYTVLALHSVSYDQILAVFLNYPQQVPDEHNTHLPFHFSGGFGLSSGRIGTIFTIYGLACGIIQFLLFPPLCSKFGALNCFKVSTILYPLVYIATPYSALIQDERNRYLALMVILLLKSFAVIIGFPCITILLTNAAPSLRILGTLNGFATTFSGLGRAFGPAITGSTFTYGVQRGYITPAWGLLAVVGFLQAIPAWMIVEGSGFAHIPDSDDEDDDDDEDLLTASDDADFSDETAVDADEQHSNLAVAIDAPDLAAAITNEPDEADSDVPPLMPGKTLHSAANVSAAPGHVRLRRMSASGQDLERDPADPKWRLKQGDDDVEG